MFKKFDLIISNGMYKLLILIIGLSFTAASCNLLTDPLNTGAKGVYISEDNGQSYNPSNQIANKGTLDNSTVYALLFDPVDPQIIYLGTSQGIYKSEDGGSTWRFILTGINVSDMAVDSSQSNIVYATGISGTNGKIIKTQDGGSSWLDIFSEPNKNNAITSISVSSTNRNMLVAGLASGEILLSQDGGESWGAGEDFDDRIVKIRYSAGNTVLLLLQRKGLYSSSDQGKTWVRKTSNLTTTSLFSPGNSLPSISLFYDLGFTPNQPQALFLATEQGLIKSQNSGESWELVNLPANTSARRVQAVVVDPNNSASIYANIGSTVFKSVNNGLTWETNKLDTEQVVRLIQINPQTSNMIYLGMGGRK
ncbi:MAG: hypothetical protein Q8P83_02720 [bacterium]|nr:hypothetical protein [bacterium]